MFLLVGDTHLSDRPRDEYRWGLFPWLLEQQQKHKVQGTFFLGDLCDAKDYHSSRLVNHLTVVLAKLQKPIFILMGNHDYVDPNIPYFRFLTLLKGLMFVYEHGNIVFDRTSVAMLPHCRDEDTFERSLRNFAAQKPKPDLLLFHNTLDGALADTGTPDKASPLTGFRASLIDLLAPELGAYGGDVHRPQRLANAVYVGAPYHIKFGDDFEPRCLLVVSKSNRQNLYFDTTHKWALTVNNAQQILDNKQLFKNDQVKITVELDAEQIVDWLNIKQQVLDAAAQKGLEVFGVTLTKQDRKHRLFSVESRTPEQIVDAFCKAEKVPEPIRRAGHTLVTKDDV